MLKKIKSLLGMAAFGIAGLVLCSAASATVLTAKTNVDNGYQIYLSTSDSVQGSLFGQGNNWYSTFTDSTSLVAGTDYFLHLYAYDQGGIAGLLGAFSLTGTDHQFANGLTSLTTNTTNWKGNNTGWGTPYTSLVDIATNGSGVWGGSFTGGVSPAAQWIWAGDANNNDQAWFSTKIVAQNKVPEPSSTLLFAVGMIGLAFLRLKKAAK